MTMLTRSSIMILLLLLAGSSFARTEPGAAQQFDEANRTYSEGRYQQAISMYRSIIAEHGFSAELLHNLANSYAGAGRKGQAILHYLRGLQLAPEDDDLRGDLALIREKSGLFTGEKTTGERFFSYYDMNQWALLALGGYVALTLLLAFSMRFRIRGKMVLSLLLAAFIALAGLGACRQHALWRGGVVVEPDIRLLTSPFATAASLGRLEEGTLVQAGKRHGDYHYVQDDRGRSGWIPTVSFEQINTRHFTYSQGGAE